MQRQLLVVVLVLGLIAIVAGAACADPWPGWNNVNGTFSCKVAKAQTSTGWDYTVKVDPDNAYPGWAIGAFAVYAENVTYQKPWFWWGYNGGNSEGWWPATGWEKNKYPGPQDTTAAFGWLTDGSLVYSGSTATFHATNLPAGFESWNQHFAVLAFGPADFGARCVELFWAPAEAEDDNGGGPPNETPEPGSLALLTLGASAVFGALKRRKTSA